MIMPDLEKMSVAVDDRCMVLRLLQNTMQQRFFEQGFWHGDPAWRNVALVRNKQGDVTKLVMIDLEPERMVEQSEKSKWQDFTTMWANFKEILNQDWESFSTKSGRSSGQ
jgi:predicted unusual protein kinase regulating ubiquinone biosynthesis (AarF/ABC1/UbiB family)